METFWAKTPIDKTVIPNWSNIHSVLHHCLDVGFVAQRMIETRWRSMRDVFRQTHSDVDEAMLTAIVLAASHDLGKITWWFQSKVESLLPRLVENGFTGGRGTELSHGQATTFFLAKRLEKDWPESPSDLSAMGAQASGCHHGTFFRVSDADLLVSGDSWEEQRNKHFDLLTETWFPGRTTLPEPDGDNPGPEWTMLVAGLISVADWVGSSLPFPVAAADQGEYISIRREQIRVRLQ